MNDVRRSPLDDILNNVVGPEIRRVLNRNDSQLVTLTGCALQGLIREHGAPTDQSGRESVAIEAALIAKEALDALESIDALQEQARAGAQQQDQQEAGDPRGAAGSSFQSADPNGSSL